MELRSGREVLRPLDDYSMTMATVQRTYSPSVGLPYTFPHLTKIIGKPTPTTLKLLTKELYANARSIPAAHDAGRYGHLGMIMPAAEYQALQNATAWVPPADPGDVPNIPNGTGGVEITNTIKTYEQELARFRTYMQVDADLKQQIIAAVEPQYLAAQEHSTLGFADKTAWDLFNHLHTVYGIIKATDIEKNRELLSSPWTPDQPIEALWKRAKDCADFADLAQEPIAEAVQIRLLKKVLQDSGVFENAIDKWDDKTVNNTTMAEFRAHFDEENERRLKKLNARQAGYSTNPSANSAQASYERGYNSGWAAGLLASNSPSSDAANAARPLTMADFLPDATSLQCHAVTKGGTQYFYCHTHGLGRNKNHTSATCNRPAEGHKREATLDNMMGGSTTIVTGRRRRTAGTSDSAE